MTAAAYTLQWLKPDWPAPASVRAAVSLRSGGVSSGRYASLNLAAHVGDDPQAVAENRRRLRAALALPAEPVWLRQVHGTRVLRLPAAGPTPEADASYTTEPGVVCAILSADCLPVLICDDAGTVVAAAHAGWRGLVNGVLEETVRVLPARPDELMAWLGPAIGPGAFEVGAEVRETFLRQDAGAAENFKAAASAGKFFADLYALARRRLARAGISRVHGGGLCTHADAVRFYSHRRDGLSGRMATLIRIAA